MTYTLLTGSRLPLQLSPSPVHITVDVADREGLMSQQPVKYVATCQSYWLSATVFFFAFSFRFTEIKTLKWSRNGKEFLVFTSYQKNRDWVGSISAWNHEAPSWSEKVSVLNFIFLPLTSSFRGSRQKWKMVIVAWAESILKSDCLFSIY